MDLLKPENSLNTTLEKSLDQIDPNWRIYNGLIIAGSWPGQDDEDFYEEHQEKIRDAYQNDVPFLGLCLGLQMMGLVFGGDLGELDKNRVGIKKIKGWWGETYESHWHRFFVEGEFPKFDVYKTDGIIEAMRAKDKKFFVGTQFHPEYESSKKNPHPILKEFLNVCKNST